MALALTYVRGRAWTELAKLGVAFSPAIGGLGTLSGYTIDIFILLVPWYFLLFFLMSFPYCSELLEVVLFPPKFISVCFAEGVADGF